MKITKSQLREIIKEEAIRVLSEMGPSEEDRELAAALSSELEKMPEGPEKEEMSPEFLDSFQILGLAMRAKREVEDARESGDINLDKLEVMLQKLVDGLSKVQK